METGGRVDQRGLPGSGVHVCAVMARLLLSSIERQGDADADSYG